jgi:multidrug efflux pump subunit AcrA (membrane-fusion protein)
LPIAIMAGGVLAYYVISQQFRSVPAQESDTLQATHAQVALVKAHAGGMIIESDGVVVPYREIKVATEVAGRVVERAEICRAGNYVKKGDRLVGIDPRDYQLDVERLEKEVQQAVVALDELNEEIQGAESLITISEKELELRTRELQRLQHLGRQAVSTSDIEKSEMSELTARHALVSLRNRVRLLRVSAGRLESARDLAASNLQKARLDLQRTEIMAPADGVIVSDFVEVDSYVQRGTLLFSLEDTSKVEVKCKLRMEDLYWLWDRSGPSTQAVANSPADAYGIPEANVQVVYRLSGENQVEYVWEGRLSRYDGAGLDEKTRTVPCRVVVDEPRERTSTHSSGPPALMRGMYVTIRIQVDPDTPLLSIPEDALRPGNQVWRVRNGKLAILSSHFVTLLEHSADEGGEARDVLVYVDDASQLTAGDQVVVSPLTFVRSGMDIEVSEVEERGSP